MENEDTEAFRIHLMSYNYDRLFNTLDFLVDYYRMTIPDSYQSQKAVEDVINLRNKIEKMKDEELHGRTK